MESLCSQPHWVNYAPSTPLRERLRSYFANDIVCAVDIGVERRPICGAIQTALDSAPAEQGLSLTRSVDWQGIAIQETRLAGITLLGQHDPNADQLCLVDQHLNEPGVGDV